MSKIFVESEEEGMSLLMEDGNILHAEDLPEVVVVSIKGHRPVYAKPIIRNIETSGGDIIVSDFMITTAGEYGTVDVYLRDQLKCLAIKEFYITKETT